MMPGNSLTRVNKFHVSILSIYPSRVVSTQYPVVVVFLNNS